MTWAWEHVAASDPLLMGADPIFNDGGLIDFWAYHA
jgi:hypothetical protein